MRSQGKFNVTEHDPHTDTVIMIAQSMLIQCDEHIELLIDHSTIAMTHCKHGSTYTYKRTHTHVHSSVTDYLNHIHTHAYTICIHV